MFTGEKLIELFHERSSICEYEAKMTRVDADLAAYADLRKLVGRTPDGRAVLLPVEIRRIVSESVNRQFAG